MNQAESSDSDSNTSSWIFLDECSNSNESEKNKYYLNCSSEPIQELTPQCFNSTNLEPESDSDGISVISESEDTKEPILSEDNHIIEDVKHVTVQEEPDKIKVEYYINKYVVIGWIIIAVMTPFVLNYFSAYVNGVSDGFQDETGVDFLKLDLLNEEKNKKLEDESSDAISVEKVSDYLPHQTNSDNQNVIQNDKKTLNSKAKINVDKLNCEEHQCDQLIIHKDKKNEKNKHKKGEFTRDEKYVFRNKFSDKEDTSKLIKNLPADQLSMQIKNPQRQNKKLMTEVKEKRKGSDMTIIKDKKGKKNKNHKKKDDSKKKANKKDKNEYHANKDKKQKKADNSKDHSYQKEIKKLKKALKHKEKEVSELVKTVKIKDKHLKMFEFKILKELNALKKPGMVENPVAKEIDNHNFNDEKLNSSSGEWYNKLYNSRSKIRKEHCASDWLFDRADFRNRRRNFRNNWYWNLMSNREQLRLRRGF